MDSPKLTPTERIVLAELLKRTNYKTWETFVGLKTIAKKTELVKATVQDAIRSLLKKGVIQKAGEQPTPNGFTNIWRIAEHFRVVPSQGMDTGTGGMDSGTVCEGMDSSPKTGYGQGMQGMDTGTDLIWIKTHIENLIENQRLLQEKIDLLLIRPQNLNTAKSDPSNRPTAESPDSAAPLCANGNCKNSAKPDTGFCSYECEKEAAECDEETLAAEAARLGL